MGLLPLCEEKETSELSPFMLYEDIARRLQARRRVLTRNWPCWHLDLGPPASKTIWKWISVVWATQYMVFCSSSPSRRRQWVLLRALPWQTWPPTVFSRTSLPELPCLVTWVHLWLLSTSCMCQSLSFFFSWLVYMFLLPEMLSPWRLLFLIL